MQKEFTPMGQVEQTPAYIAAVCALNAITPEEFDEFGLPLEFEEGNQLIDWILESHVISSSMDYTLEQILETPTTDTVRTPNLEGHKPVNAQEWPIIKLARLALNRLRRRT